MQALFAYGTLMSDEIAKAVIGFVPEKQRGTISGFQRYAVKNAHYPGIKPVENSTVEGVVYFDINERSWQRLDLFEGDMYYRRQVIVRLDDGMQIQAHVYVVKSEFFSSLADHDWSFARFTKSGKTSFVSRYDGFDSLNS
ncbi:MAG: gamma-glutamylcyclotransferase family protein [Desulfocapsaceae bacterium]|nr:gamma-glutamylcyclotransferase family protein [Desulfocapsaceae bacterium]